MKKILFIILCSFGLWSACTEEKPDFYRGGNGICFYYDYSGPFDSDPYFGEDIDGRDSTGLVFSTKLRDTLYYRIMVYGQPSTKERYFSLRQSTLSYLDSTSYINESTGRVVPVEGVNFVAFDDPEMEKYYVIHPDSSSVYVPIIMIYDSSMAGKEQTFQLFFEIVPNDELTIFDPRFYRATAIFSQSAN